MTPKKHESNLARGQFWPPDKKNENRFCAA
jgi:hypothetical protein